jgi:Fe-Mn family superoxide dismutase
MRFTQFLNENREKIIQKPLLYKKTDLEPVLSEAALDYHYNGLASKYFNRYNNGDGDLAFNYGGAMLHNIYFAQFCEKDKTQFGGMAKIKIERKFGTLARMKEAIEKEAMAIQGSGWVYLDYKMNIHTIHNHEYNDEMEIVLLIDWWEHAWALDYQADKKSYLNNIYGIIDWGIISDRCM